MNEIKVEMDIYQKIQELRYRMSLLPLKKTGYNKALNYYYFELANFLGEATKLMKEMGMCPIFCIGYDSNGVEIATLTVYSGAERVTFSTPTADVPRLEGIFGLGAKHTYCKRYLYVNLLDLTEQDVAEMTNEGKEAKVEEKKATPKQVEMIRGLYDEENIAKMIEYYGVNSLDELSLKQASEAIKRKTGK